MATDSIRTWMQVRLRLRARADHLRGSMTVVILKNQKKLFFPN